MFEPGRCPSFPRLIGLLPSCANASVIPKNPQVLCAHPPLPVPVITIFPFLFTKGVYKGVSTVSGFIHKKGFRYFLTWMIGLSLILSFPGSLCMFQKCARLCRNMDLFSTARSLVLFPHKIWFYWRPFQHSRMSGVSASKDKGRSSKGDHSLLKTACPSSGKKVENSGSGCRSTQCAALGTATHVSL